MSNQTRILVVDDNPDMLDICSQFLGGAGYEVIEAETGEECLSIVREQRPEIVLLDVILPGIDGFDVCKTIKSDPSMAGVFVVLISGEVTAAENKIAGLNAGADEYIARPIMMQELIARVDAMVRIQKSEAALREAHAELERRVAARTQELYASEKRFRTFIELAPEVVFSLDAAGVITSLNPAFEALTTWKREEWLGKKAVALLDPRDRELAVRTFQKVLRHRAPEVVELRVCSRTGDVIAGEFTVAALVEQGEAIGLFGFARDITGRKRAEALLRDLTRRLLDAQEVERRRVARELHDSVGQLLSSVRFRMQAIEVALAKSAPALAAKATKAGTLLENAVQEVRRISYNLRPSELDDLGLIPTIRSACEDFQERSGTAVDLHLSRLPKRLPAHLDLTIYRIVQEALSNIEKHAQASRVTLSLRPRDGFVTLKISDDGKGFDPLGDFPSRRRRHGLGLLNMRERTAFAGGTFEIDSARKKGTAISVTLPLNTNLDGQ